MYCRPLCARACWWCCWLSSLMFGTWGADTSRSCLEPSLEAESLHGTRTILGDHPPKSPVRARRKGKKRTEPWKPRSGIEGKACLSAPVHQTMRRHAPKMARTSVPDVRIASCLGVYPGGRAGSKTHAGHACQPAHGMFVGGWTDEHERTGGHQLVGIAFVSEFRKVNLVNPGKENTKHEVYFLVVLVFPVPPPPTPFLFQKGTGTRREELRRFFPFFFFSTHARSTSSRAG